MNKIFNTQHSSATDLALLLLRVFIGAMMLRHGLPKMEQLFSNGPVQFPGVMGMSPTLSLGLAVFAEVLCSILIMIGLGTRLATIAPIITMLVALLTIHAADPFDKKEPASHYLLVYVAILLAGAGKYSLDYLLSRKKQIAA